jgi:hypothetical protein
VLVQGAKQMTQAITRESLYESDFLLWTQDTVAKLRARDFDHVDLENLIEEIESLGRSEKQELENRLEILLAHFLKRIYVDLPDCFNGWQNTIREQCRRISLRLQNTPSLKAAWDKSFDDAFFLALGSVKDEYEPKGYQIPDKWQFGRDIDTILKVNFWDDDI